MPVRPAGRIGHPIDSSGPTVRRRGLARHRRMFADLWIRFREFLRMSADLPIQSRKLQPEVI